MAQATKSKDKTKSVDSKASRKKTKVAKATKDSKAKSSSKNRTTSAPSGWFLSGAAPQEYETGVDFRIFHSGTRSAYMKNAVPRPTNFGTLMQQFEPGDFLGKRVRMSFWVKSKDASWVAPWMRVDGDKGTDATLSFDNFCNRVIKGTTDWTHHEIVLDVPKESTNIAFGIMLSGRGILWFDDIEFEKVSKSVAATDCPCHTKNSSKPRNLSFEDDK
jgi:hypothetical protein